MKFQAKWFFKKQVPSTQWEPANVKGEALDGTWKYGKLKATNFEILESVPPRKLALINDLLAGLLRKKVEVPDITMGKTRSKVTKKTSGKTADSNAEVEVPTKKKSKKKKSTTAIDDDEVNPCELEAKRQKCRALEERLEKLTGQQDDLIKSTSSLKDENSKFIKSTIATTEDYEPKLQKSAELIEKC